MSTDQTASPDAVPAASPDVPAAAPESLTMPPLAPVLGDHGERDGVELAESGPARVGSFPTGRPAEAEILGAEAVTVPVPTRSTPDDLAAGGPRASSAESSGSPAAGAHGESAARTPTAAGGSASSPAEARTTTRATPTSSRRSAPPKHDLGDTAVRRRSLFPSPEAQAADTGAAATVPVSLTEAQAAGARIPTTVAATPAPAESRPAPPISPARPRPDEQHTPTPVAAPTSPARLPVPGRSEDEVLLDGSVVAGRPPSRAAAHWAGVLVSIVALPVSWFFLHKGAARAIDSVEALRFGLNGPALALGALGALALIAALWTARRSSLGMFVVGALSILLGLVTTLLPGSLNASLSPLLERLTIHSGLGADLASFLWADITSGRFIAFGVFMTMVGVVSHSARRAGRHEQESLDRVHRA